MRKAAIAATTALFVLLLVTPTHADKLVLLRGRVLTGCVVGPKTPAANLAPNGLITFDLGDSVVIPDSTKLDKKIVFSRQRTYPLDSLTFITLEFDDHEESYTRDEIKARSLTRTPLSLGIGANLNFLDGIKLSNLYADLDLYLPDTFHDSSPKWRELTADVHKNAKGERSKNELFAKGVEKLAWWALPSGFSLGMEQGRLVGRDTSRVLRVQLSDDSAGVKHFRDTTYTLKRDDKSDVTTLSFGVYWSLWHKRDLDHRVSVFLVLLNEMRRVEFSSTPGAVAGTNQATIPLSDSDKRESTVSFGFAGAVSTKEFEARVISTIKNNQRDDHWRAYLVQGRLISNRYGIMLGGEARGLGMPPRISGDTRHFPEFEVYAAKMFALDKLLDFVTGPASSK